MRIRRTRRLLAQALIELAREQPFESITVKTVTDRAEVGYATFFRHYSSPADLMRGVVDELLDDLKGLLPPLAGHDPQHAGTLLFQHARQHADTYHLLLRADRSLGLVASALESGRQGITEAFDARPGSRVPLEIAANHIVRSCTSLLEWWLEQGMPYDPERMGEIFCDLIMEPTERVALMPRRPESALDLPEAEPERRL